MANMPNKALVFLEEVTKTPFFDQTHYFMLVYSLKNKGRRKQSFQKSDKRPQEYLPLTDKPSDPISWV